MTAYVHPHNALPQGHRLQEYKLVRVLGSGGFSITYRGHDHKLNKPFAIKEYLPSDIATRTAAGSVAPGAGHRKNFDWGLSRFLDEAHTLACFNHRYIVKVNRRFEENDTAYIVMEYVEGETLSAYLARQGRLSEAELKAILYPILDGLAVVHKAGILHRDIKPLNIMIRAEDGSPVLIDFGAARQAIGAKSRQLSVVVTSGYAPIEQYSERGDQGPWTDIYALGAVCYQALTGQVPDEAPARVPHDPLHKCTGQASQEFLSAIDWALSVHKDKRPQSVAEWRKALEADDLAEASQPQNVQGEQRHRRRWTQVALVLAGALVLGSLGSWYLSGQEEVDIYKEALHVAIEADGPQPLKDFVARYPNSQYVSEAKKLIQVWDKRAD